MRTITVFETDKGAVGMAFGNDLPENTLSSKVVQMTEQRYAAILDCTPKQIDDILRSILSHHG